MLEALHPDIVYVESIAHAYSEIKRVTPDLVIVCLSSDDLDACRVLSMLRLDSETSRIPVLTCVTASSEGSGNDGAGADEDALSRVAPISLH